SGVFLSSYLDWFHTASSQLVGSHPGEDGRELRLNGGCTYLTASNGKRNNLQERWILTVSRQFEEVLPAIPQALPREGAEWLRGLVWYEIPRIDSTEEAYVDCYERLRTLRQWGMSELLVLHPDDIWHDGDGRTALGMTAAEAKGGDDALQEYLEAVSDLGFTCALPCSYAHVSKLDAIWEKESAALNADGSSATAGPNRHLLKPTRALGVARDHLGAMLEKYGARVAYLGGHCGSPPWDRVDCDSRLEKPASWRATLEAEHELLAGLRQLAEPAEGIVIGEGGTHWLYAGLLDGFRARHPGPGPCRQPLLVDFALNSLRTSLVVMRDALDKFAADRGRYPDSLEQLVQERYLRQIPEDPITGSSQTWVVQPPPTNADIGGAVGDVRSGAPGPAPDGSLYADW
ncbi:MAG: hypothetical protein IIA03_02865, partial [Proteobacteria bacterium]|nr:hypothetical protein [Pseudomonadota bacterium]